jgi:sarcosine oxidase gamma subunit
MEIPIIPRRTKALLKCGPRLLAAIVIVCGWMGCASAPRSWQVTHDPLLERHGGVLLLVDASVQENTLVGQDYFVINEAEAGAETATAALRNYIQAGDISVRAEVITVGGARLTANNALINVADSVGGPMRQAQQPLRVPGTIQDDAPYVKALCTISTYAFERAAVPSNAPTTISVGDFRMAAEVIQNRTQASSVLFLGVLGKSRSTGKRVAQVVAALAVGEAVAFATAGLGTGYYLIFIPGHTVDGMVMEGALIDLDSGQLTWSNAVRSTDDPVRPEAMADPQSLDLLFHSIIFKPVSGQLMPSAKP